MLYINKIFYKLRTKIQKTKTKDLIKEESKRITRTAKIHPHLHYHSSNIYLLLSLLNLYQKQHNKALEYCNFSILHDPQYAIAHHLKQIITQKQSISKHDFNKLIRDSMPLTRLLSNYDHIQLLNDTKNQSLYYQGNKNLHLKKTEQAIKDLKKYIKNNKKNSSALSDLGRALILKKQYKEAISYLENSIAQHKAFATYLWLGTTYLLLNDFKKANNQLLAALQNINCEHEIYHKNFSKQYYKRAKLHYKLGEIDLSLNDLNKSLDLHRSNLDSLLLRSKVLLPRTNFVDASIDIEKLESKYSEDKQAKKLKHNIDKLKKELQHFS